MKPSGNHQMQNQPQFVGKAEADSFSQPAQLGDFAGAARFASQYDREYPQGRRRAEVRRFARLE